MITPSFGLTATERVLPSFTLDWTTGATQLGVDVVRAGVATFINSSGSVESATADTQRIDYSTGTAGLLIEESRINLAPYSEDINTAYSKVRTSVTSDVFNAPNETLTADKIVEDNSLATSHYIREQLSLAASTTYTYSIFLHASERTQAFIYLFASSGLVSSANIFIDLVNGSVTLSGATGGIIPLANDWYRVYITHTTNATAGTKNFDLYLAVNGNSSYDGDGTSGLYAWGSQIEAGAFPTSYISTEASAVTRNADAVTVAGTDFTNFFNAVEGSFAVEYQTSVAAGGGYAMALSLDAVNYILIGGNIISGGQNKARYVNRIATVTNVNAFSDNAISLVAPNKIGFCYKADDFALSLNSGAMLTDNDGAIATFTGLEIGSFLQGAVRAGYINGHVQKLQYWPQRLINAELQAFSK
jgi:hypothetical protein